MRQKTRDTVSFLINFKLNKLIDVHFYSDGIELSQSGKVKPIIIQFNQKDNIEVIGAILQYATNYFNV